MSEVLAFPGGYNPRDIRGMAIEFAAKLAGGEYGNVTSAAIIFNTEHGLGLMTAGPTGGYELIGMFEAAKMSVFADSQEDEE